MADLKLVPFGFENAEQVLNWRNSERVRKNMIDDTIITPKQHSLFLTKLRDDSSANTLLSSFVASQSLRFIS